MREGIEAIRQALKETAEHIRPPASLQRKVMKELELLNKKGDLLGKVTVDTLGEEDPMDQIIQQLIPGTGKAIYVAGGNPDRIISNQTNYAHEPWHEGMEALRDRLQPCRFSTPADARLERIFVMYGFDSLTDQEKQEMYEEADRTGQPVIVRDLKKSQRLVGAKLEYSKEGHSFELHILTTTKNRIHVPDIDSHHIERVSVGGGEGVYLADAAHQQLLWIVEEAEGSRIQYDLRTFHATREWVWSIAERMMCEQ